MAVDVLYLSWNREEFTRATFETLIANTAWSLVRELRVYDDGSIDGTYEYLLEAIERVPLHPMSKTLTMTIDWRSPPRVMNDYVRSADGSDFFAKIDNDVMVPEMWLEELLDVMEREPDLDLLGMEAGQTWLIGLDGREWDGVRRAEPCSHIGGIGLMRTEAFSSRTPLMEHAGRVGFDHWQKENGLSRAWISPDLFCPLLDRMPTEPWVSLSAKYAQYGWQRAHPKYDPQWAKPYYEWTEGRVFA